MAASLSGQQLEKVQSPLSEQREMRNMLAPLPYEVSITDWKGVLENIGPEGFIALKEGVRISSEMLSFEARGEFGLFILEGEKRFSKDAFSEEEKFTSFLNTYLPDYSLKRDSVIKDYINSRELGRESMEGFYKLLSENALISQDSDSNFASLRNAASLFSEKLSANEKSLFFSFLATGDSSFLPDKVKITASTQELNLDSLSKRFHLAGEEERRAFIVHFALGKNGILNESIPLSGDEKNVLLLLKEEYFKTLDESWSAEKARDFLNRASGSATSLHHLNKKFFSSDSADNVLQHRNYEKARRNMDLYILPSGEAGSYLKVYSDLDSKGLKERLQEIESISSDYDHEAAYHLWKRVDHYVQEEIVPQLPADMREDFVNYFSEGNEIFFSPDTQSKNAIYFEDLSFNSEILDNYYIKSQLLDNDVSLDRELQQLASFDEELNVIVRDAAKRAKDEILAIGDFEKTKEYYDDFINDTKQEVNNELGRLEDLTYTPEMLKLLSFYQKSDEVAAIMKGLEDEYGKSSMLNDNLDKLILRLNESTAFNSFILNSINPLLEGMSPKTKKVVEESLSIAFENYSPYRRVLLLEALISKSSNQEEASEAEKVRSIFEALGPVGRKFGQILSDRPEIISDREIREELAKLKDSSSEIDKKAVLESAVASGIDVISIGENLSAASIKQANEATVNIDGEEVSGVLKTLRPTLKDDLKEDAEVAKFLARHFEEEAPGMEPAIESMVKEIYNEADLRLEALKQKVLHDNIDGEEHFGFRTTVPVAILYSETSMFEPKAQGVPLSSLEKSSDLPTETYQAIVSSFFTQVIRDGFFHADLHSGNIFLDGDNLSFIDVGMVGELAPEGRVRFLKMVSSFENNKGDDAMSVLDEIVNDTSFLEASERAELTNLFSDKSKSLEKKIQQVIVAFEDKLPNEYYVLLKGLASVSPYMDKIKAEEYNSSQIAEEVLINWLSSTSSSELLLMQSRSELPFRRRLYAYLANITPDMSFNSIALTNELWGQVIRDRDKE